LCCSTLPGGSVSPNSSTIVYALLS
jgi:hypothetical protein